MKASLEKVSLLTPITVTAWSQVTVITFGDILVPSVRRAAETANFCKYVNNTNGYGTVSELVAPILYPQSDFI